MDVDPGGFIYATNIDSEGCAKGEGCQPRSGFVSAKHKTVYALGVLSAIKAHCEHQGKKQC